jgi:uncharacterized YigZ family protein
MDDSFTTIAGSSQRETRVLGSRFLAVAEPVEAKGDVEAVLARLRKEYHDATHHCYAYRIGQGLNEFRANDDGEPSGSAGRPILAAIDRAGFTDVLVVVIRYFGGTKLGLGGLVRAYGEAAGAALGAAEKKVCYLLDVMHIDFPHDRIGAVMHVLGSIGAKIRQTEYGADVRLTLEIRKSKSAELKNLLIERTGGTVKVTEE